MKEKILEHRLVAGLLIVAVLAFSAGYLILYRRSTSDPKAAQLPPRWTTTPIPTKTLYKTATITTTPSPTLTPTTTQTATSQPPAYEPIATKLSEIDGMEMVYVPAGRFLMGLSDDDKTNLCYSDCIEEYFLFEMGGVQPQHNVYLNAYWIDRTEVTNEMFAAFLNAEGNQTVEYIPWLVTGVKDPMIEESGGVWSPVAKYADHPVTHVTWFGARAYCTWAGRRLPTEAEWERAAHGDDDRLFPWGDEYDSDLINPGRLPVGSSPAAASPFSALDMIGGAVEWVADWYDEEYYTVSPATNPSGPPTPPFVPFRVVRGISSWTSDGYRSTVVTRIGFHPSENFGFRCALIYDGPPIAYSTSTPSPQSTAPPTAPPTPTPEPTEEEILELGAIHMTSATHGWGKRGSSLFTTRDGGRTWRNVTPQKFITDDLSIVAFEYLDENRAWVIYDPYPGLQGGFGCVAADASVLYTTDGGATWDASQPLMHDLADMSCRASIDMTDNQKGWLSIDGWYTAAGPHTEMQLFQTADGGNTWDAVEASWCHSEDSCSSYTPGWISEKAFSGQSGWLLENMHECQPCYGNVPEPAYYVTTDGGATWNLRYIPSPTGDPVFYEQYFFCEPYQLNLITDEIVRLQLSCSQYEFDATPGPKDYIYASDDGGLTWITHEMPSSSGRMIFFDKHHGLLLGREMWRTEDGGVAWERINTVIWDGQFSFVDPWYGWAVAESEEGEIALVYTTNGAETWKILNPVEVE